MDSVMAESPDPVSEKLQLAKSLVSHLEAGNDDEWVLLPALGYSDIFGVLL